MRHVPTAYKEIQGRHGPRLDDGQVVRIRMDRLTVRNVRNWGEAWLGLELWDKLGLDGFWREVSDTPRHLWSIRAPFIRR